MRAFTLLILALAAFSHSASAVVYPLPPGNSALTGKNLEITIPQDSKLSLESFAAQYQMGLSNLLEANPGVDVYLPKPGSKLIIPQQLILPNTPRQGIIVNSAEMRLYYYPLGSNTVVVLPIGIGELGKGTPINWTTTVERKKAGPSWVPTKKMHEEYAARGESLPAVFPPGPNNPMGLYALYVGRLYAIHGTNANFGIGLRVSHGCVRLRADDIKWLFDNVPTGTRVQFIDQPVKATVEPDGSRYIEVHDPLSTSEDQLTSTQPVPITMTPAVSKIVSDASVNQHALDNALQARSGMPVKINGTDDDATQPAALPETEGNRVPEGPVTPQGTTIMSPDIPSIPGQPAGDSAAQAGVTDTSSQATVSGSGQPVPAQIGQSATAGSNSSPQAGQPTTSLPAQQATIARQPSVKVTAQPAGSDKSSQPAADHSGQKLPATPAQHS